MEKSLAESKILLTTGYARPLGFFGDRVRIMALLTTFVIPSYHDPVDMMPLTWLLLLLMLVSIGFGVCIFVTNGIIASIRRAASVDWSFSIMKARNWLAAAPRSRPFSVGHLFCALRYLACACYTILMVMTATECHDTLRATIGQMIFHWEQMMRHQRNVGQVLEVVKYFGLNPWADPSPEKYTDGRGLLEACGGLNPSKNPRQIAPNIAIQDALLVYPPFQPKTSALCFCQFLDTNAQQHHRSSSPRVEYPNEQEMMNQDSGTTLARKAAPLRRLMAREELVSGLDPRRCVGSAMLWERLEGEMRYQDGVIYRKVRNRKGG